MMISFNIARILRAQTSDYTASARHALAGKRLNPDKSLQVIAETCWIDIDRKTFIKPSIKKLEAQIGNVYGQQRSKADLPLKGSLCRAP